MRTIRSSAPVAVEACRLAQEDGSEVRRMIASNCRSDESSLTLSILTAGFMHSHCCGSSSRARHRFGSLHRPPLARSPVGICRRRDRLNRCLTPSCLGSGEKSSARHRRLQASGESGARTCAGASNLTVLFAAGLTLTVSAPSTRGSPRG